jgi:hypothetical protein
MHFLAARGVIETRKILDGLPHPSGANAERIACFLGTKSPEAASPKTDAHRLIAARENLRQQVRSISVA